MTQVVQARCPHCQQVLRIPADWLDKPMRCKLCRNTFEARPRTNDTPLPPTALSAGVIGRPATIARPAAAVQPAVAASDAQLFGTANEASLQTSPARLPTRGVGKIIVLVGCLGLFLMVVPAVVGVVLIVVYSGGLPTLLSGGDAEEAEAAKDEQSAKDAKGGKAKDKALAKDKKGQAGAGGGPTPRRALIIGVNNYLYLNSVHNGKDEGRITGLPDFVLANPPLKISPQRTFVVCDGSKNPHSTERTVLRHAIKDFLDTSRAQDRVLILFAGHATDIDKDSYLIPINGRKENPDTLVPLKWVYDEMAACKARQKVLVLDVFRFAPARGFELPGAGASEEGEMGEVFAQNLKNPPPGVQVWCACSKGQRSIEFEGGSVFLEALRHTLDHSWVNNNDPLPVTQSFVDKVNRQMKELIGGQKFVQVSQLTGSPPASGADYDANEPAALPIAIKQPDLPGGDAASNAEVDSILSDIKRLPAVRSARAGEEDRLLKAVNLPPFPAKVLNKYRPDDKRTLAQLLDEFGKVKAAVARDKYAKEHPVRGAVLDAIEGLNKTEHLQMREDLRGPLNDKAKAAFLREQKEPGLLIFELEQVLDRVKSAKSDMDNETSKRWRAHFDFTEARLKARLVYLYEYNYLLAAIRRDELPPLDKDQDGWRVGSRKKIQVNEVKAKTYAKEADKLWKQIQKDYPDTPWAILAYRENLVALGLEWKAKKE
jgi:hypothetical protein